MDLPEGNQPELIFTVEDLVLLHCMTVLKKCRGNKTVAAKKVGISRAKFFRLVNKFKSPAKHYLSHCSYSYDFNLEMLVAREALKDVKLKIEELEKALR